MRTNACAAVVASFLAVLLAFATTSALAETMTKPTMEPSGTSGVIKGKAAGEAETEFSGEATTGAGQKEKAFKERGMKHGVKGEFKGGVRSMPEGKSSREFKGQIKSETTGRMERSPEARMPVEKGTGQRVEGGEAIVARIDRPKNCLRVRSGPGASHDEIGCAAKGDKLILTGVFSKDRRWAQLDNNGWVHFSQLSTQVRPPMFASSGESFDQPAATAGKKKKFRRGHKRFHGHGHGFGHGFGHGCGYGCGDFYGYPYGGYYYPYGGGYYSYPSYYYGGSRFGGGFGGFPFGFAGGLFGGY